MSSFVVHSSCWQPKVLFGGKSIMWVAYFCNGNHLYFTKVLFKQFLICIAVLYNSMIVLGVKAIVVPAAKNAASILKTSYVTKTTFTERYILVHLVSNIVFTTRKHFQAAGYWILNSKNSKFICLMHSLTTVVRIKTKQSSTWPPFYTTQEQTHRWDVPFGVLMSELPLCLAIPFMFH